MMRKSGQSFLQSIAAYVYKLYQKKESFKPGCESGPGLCLMD